MTTNYEQLTGLRLLCIAQLGGGWAGRGWGLHIQPFSILTAILTLYWYCNIRGSSPASRALWNAGILPDCSDLVSFCQGRIEIWRLLKSFTWFMMSGLAPWITSKKFWATAGYVNSAPDSRWSKKVFWQDGRKCWTAVDCPSGLLGIHLVKKQCQVEIPEERAWTSFFEGSWVCNNSLTLFFFWPS